jgi:hypothetical protein
MGIYEKPELVEKMSIVLWKLAETVENHYGKRSRLCAKSVNKNAI